jgi:threonine/homoserine/homoserine lactone efflux protein
MESSLTLSSIVALGSAMMILAAIPSVSVLAVSTRAATYGLIHGIFTSLGIVAGDIVFIILALWGLSFLMETLGDLFVFVKYLGGAYLIFLGIGLWRSKLSDLEVETALKSSLLSSFLAGLFITFADQKAVLFYLGFFPAFFDISQISYVDTGIIIGITIVAVGGVKIAYALMVDRARLLINQQTRKWLNLVAGWVMMAAGIVVIVKP